MTGTAQRDSAAQARSRSPGRSVIAAGRPSRTAAQVARDAHRALERLLVVEPRVDAGLVGALEVDVRQAARAARALGDVLAGELDVDAAQVRAELGVEHEALLELVDDLVEPAGLDAAGGGLGVGVPRVADPEPPAAGAGPGGAPRAGAG